MTVEDGEEREARLQAILDTAVDGIVTIYSRGVIESFNRAAEWIFGYQAGEVIGKNGRMLMPEPDRSAHDGYLENYHRTGVAKIIGIGREVIALRKDGTTFPADLAVSRVTFGPHVRFIGVIRDITERKAGEAALLEANRTLETKNKELEEKNRRLARFNRLFVDRELRIKELRAKVRALEKRETAEK